MNLSENFPLKLSNLALFKVLLLLISFFPQSTFAEWVYITSNDVGNDFYVSSESIKNSGWNKRTAVELINYSDGTKTPFKSGTVQHEYECNSNRVKVLSATAHSELFGKGEVLVRKSTQNAPWQSLPKFSVANQTRDYICNQSLGAK